MANVPLSFGAATESPPAAIRNGLPALVFVVFAAGLLFVGAHHEAWFDEAQAWLIARDASPWEIITRYARYEGTPPLWHLVLWPLVHLGLPYGAFWLVPGACALLGAALILLRSPFPLWMRCGWVFGYFFAYQYGVVARSYSLDLALVPLLALLFERRLDRPMAYGVVLGLFANTNTHSFLISGVLALEIGVAALWSGRWREPCVLAGAAIYAALAGFAVITAWPPRDVSFHTYSIGPVTAARAALLMAEPFIERIDVFSAGQPQMGSRAAGLILTLCLFLPSVALFRRARVSAVFFGALAVFYAFTAAKYGQGWHMGILYLVWLFALWAAWPKLGELARGERLAVLVSVGAILAVQGLYTAAAWARDVAQPYAPGRPLAQALMGYQAAHPGARIGGFGSKVFVAQPWAGANLFANYDDHAAKPAFFDWRTSQPYLRDPSFDDWAAAVKAKRYDVLVLGGFEDVDPAEAGRFLAVARAGGYCPRVFPGDMVWKTYTYETERVAMFTRCAG
jgi:hypothetical protein